jgi:hypothetical protein
MQPIKNSQSLLQASLDSPKSYHPNTWNNRIIPFIINKNKSPIPKAIPTGSNKSKKGNKRMKAIPTSSSEKISMIILLMSVCPWRFSA